MKTFRLIELLVVLLIGFGVTASLSQAQVETAPVLVNVQI